MLASSTTIVQQPAQPITGHSKDDLHSESLELVQNYQPSQLITMRTKLNNN